MQELCFESSLSPLTNFTSVRVELDLPLSQMDSIQPRRSSESFTRSVRYHPRTTFLALDKHSQNAFQLRDILDLLAKSSMLPRLPVDRRRPGVCSIN